MKDSGGSFDDVGLSEEDVSVMLVIEDISSLPKNTQLGWSTFSRA